MENQNGLHKKYGLLTAIAMVVGIVIGSGVFFKAQVVLQKTQGDMPLGILAWIIGGAIMIICSLTFSNMATKYEKVNGVVDYAEALVGPRYAYLIGWFMTLIYYPTLTSVLSWLSARYTMELFGSSDIAGPTCMALAGVFLIGSYVMNALSPVIAGKFQVSTTIIKLIPLLLMAVVGSIVGITNGNISASFATAGNGNASSLLAAIVATAFAYEGWIIATSINAELKNAKRNLPIALTVGSIIVVCVYIIYYIGLAGGASVTTLINDGATVAFTNIFKTVGGTILKAFIVISCLGTLNGLMLGCTRGMYSIAVRGGGPRPDIFSEVSPKTNMPTNSAIFGLLVSVLWLFYFFGANLRDNLFGIFGFDSSELPIVTLYALYLPIFILFIKKSGKDSVFKNKILPLLSIIAALVMIFAAIYAHGIEPYLNAKDGSKVTETTVQLSVKDGKVQIGDGITATAYSSGEFTVDGVDYIVDDEGVRVTFNSETDRLVFNNSDGSEISPEKVKSNSVLVLYNTSKLTNVTYNDNITFATKGDLTIRASYTTKSPSFSCPVLFYFIVFGVIMGVGSLFLPKGIKRAAKETAATETDAE